MESKSSFTLEILKDDRNKYLFCIIKIAQRSTTYFFGQNKTHFTHRWLQPHHWAAFDEKIHKLFKRNTLNDISQPLHFQLIESLFLKITKAKIPIDLLCKTITDIEISPEDVISAIECKLEYKEKSCENRKHHKESRQLRQENSCKEKLHKENVTLRKDVGNGKECFESIISINNKKEPIPKSIHKGDSSNEHLSSTSKETQQISENSGSYNGSHKNVNSSKEQFECTPRTLNKNSPYTENLISPKEQIEKSTRKLRKKTPSRENLTPHKDRHIQSPKSSRKKISYKENQTSSSNQKHCNELNRIADLNSSDEDPISNITLFPDKKNVYRIELGNINVLSSLDEDESDTKSVTSSSQREKTISRIIAQSPTKYDELFSESDKNGNNRPKRKKRKENIDISDTSEDSPEGKNLDKGLAVFNSNARISKKPIVQNFVKNTESKQALIEKPKYKRLVPEKSIAGLSKNISKRKKLEVKPINCQENRSMNEWLHKKASLVNKEKADTRNKLNTSPPLLNNQVLSSQSSTQSSSQEKEQAIEFALTSTKSNHETNISKLIKEMTPAKVEILDLMKLNKDEIIKTFDEYEPKLKDLFHKFASKPKQKWNNGVNHFMIMDLLSSDTELRMMQKLSEHYEKTNCVPKYGELFSMVLMPEWILSLFMKHYSMTREKAIQYIKQQHAYKVHTQSDIQFDDTIIF